MRDWSYPVNNLWGTGFYNLEEAPWWVFFIQWLNFRIAVLVPAIKFPRWKMKEPETGESTTMREWYGDLNQCFWLAFTDPVFHWTERKKKITTVEVGYDLIRKNHYEDNREWFDEMDSQYDQKYIETFRTERRLAGDLK